MEEQNLTAVIVKLLVKLQWLMQGPERNITVRFLLSIVLWMPVAL